MLILKKLNNISKTKDTEIITEHQRNYRFFFFHFNERMIKLCKVRIFSINANFSRPQIRQL